VNEESQEMKMMFCESKLRSECGKVQDEEREESFEYRHNWKRLLAIPEMELYSTK
jgi:hypothetical protein